MAMRTWAPSVNQGRDIDSEGEAPGDQVLPGSVCSGLLPAPASALLFTPWKPPVPSLTGKGNPPQLPESPQVGLTSGRMVKGPACDAPHGGPSKRLRGKQGKVRLPPPNHAPPEANPPVRRISVMTIVALFSVLPDQIAINVGDMAGLNLMCPRVERANHRRYYWEGYTAHNWPVGTMTDHYPARDLAISAMNEGVGEYIVQVMRRLPRNSDNYQALTCALLDSITTIFIVIIISIVIIILVLIAIMTVVVIDFLQHQRKC